MPEPEVYDAVVIGSGEAGKFMCWHLGSLGQRVVVVERRYLGGACPNIACLPSKNVIHTAKVASYFRRAEEFGMRVDGFRVDMAGVHANKQRMIEGLHALHRSKFEASHTTFLWGSAKFVGDRTVDVTMNDGRETRTLRGTRVFLDIGSRATLEPIPGLADAKPLTHVEALDLTILPKHLVILGGGYVGLELAQAMRRLGSKVTVLERSERILPREDADVADGIAQVFAGEGIEILTQAKVSRIEGRSGDAVRVVGTIAGEERSIAGSHLLVATGRTPNTDGLGLAKGGIALTPNGYVKVNDRLETTAENVWAMGDCAGSPKFTHISYEDFRIVRDNLDGGHRSTVGRQVPSCIFTDPEFARVGLNESEAREKKIPYRLAKAPMAAVLRTRTLNETRGFLKALIGAKDDKVLGFTGFGWSVGELLPPFQLAMKHDLPYTAIDDLVVTHPTIAEGLGVVFSGKLVPISV
ncbi:PF00070 family, FAD-dependent NAD(P)-disulfide oxidoreductase [Labilithrix luteola]|uniref:PF00070 family, FAD-dependent NAD(P)-disulfide oxidoreductase n=1 Tax=Labilithrix luteola TaxID=1391654 RepID=A0A0K1QEC8_9BACT|nr:FAD-dependent oxidoreductase [Labilithrix luteola]AKV04022.1 PF00070 family, FAD-dependent NAD(P)-disulfide oxidoreductase [Labilithrix luteola]